MELIKPDEALDAGVNVGESKIKLVFREGRKLELVFRRFDCV